MDIGAMINQAGGIGAIASQLGIDEATAEIKRIWSEARNKGF